MKLKEVSIIIPCYNCQDLVGETLDSLAKQTYANFEVVCVNDGSTDATPSVLQEWKEKNLFEMQIVDKPNGGVSSARNAGIRAATGEYILFLDSDDLYHPTYIAQLLKAIKETKADVAYCWLSREYDAVFGERTEANAVMQTQSQAMYNLLYRMPKVGFYCYLYRREWILREQLEFDENTRRFEDREFNWKYLCHCKSAVLLDDCLYYYRVNTNSVTQSKMVEWKTERLDAVKRVEAYMSRMNCEFLPELKNYLFQRVMWGTAKNYALGGAKDAFKRLGREYDVKACMKRTARDNNKLVALASWCYLVHPSLFYHVIRLKK